MRKSVINNKSDWKNKIEDSGLKELAKKIFDNTEDQKASTNLMTTQIEETLEKM